MDSRLEMRLQRLTKQLEKLRDAEKVYLTLEAHEDVLFAQLYLKVTGGENVKMKESLVYASEDWINFAVGLKDAKAAFNDAKRTYELRLKSFDAEYLTLKTEVPVIRRQGA